MQLQWFLLDLYDFATIIQASDNWSANFIAMEMGSRGTVEDHHHARHAHGRLYTIHAGRRQSRSYPRAQSSYGSGHGSVVRSIIAVFSSKTRQGRKYVFKR